MPKLGKKQNEERIKQALVATAAQRVPDKGLITLPRITMWLKYKEDQQKQAR
jgi:hypothetical protein